MTVETMVDSALPTIIGFGVSIVGALAVRAVKQLDSTVSELKTGINGLIHELSAVKIQMIVTVERMDHHSRRADSIETRLAEVERAVHDYDSSRVD